MQKRSIILIGLVSIIFLCGACVGTKSTTEDFVQNVEVRMLERGAYSLAIPNSIMVQEEGNGELTFFQGGNAVGGILVIPFENADALRIDEISDEKTSIRFDDLLSAISSEEEISYMFSTHKDTFCLSLVSESEENAVESIHYFFPDGDVFYDLFFQREGSLSEIDQQEIYGSFVLDP